MLDLSAPFGISGSGTSYKNNLVATSDPTVNDDTTAGYSALSLWANISGATAEIFMCVDATAGAAKWVKTSLTIDELGTMALQNYNAVNVTGGTISGITDLAVADGGTGASTAAGARTNLGAHPLNLDVQNATASGGTHALPDVSGSSYLLVGTTNHTFRLPDTPAYGYTVFVKNLSTGTLTISVQGSNLIEGASTLTLSTGDSFRLIYQQANNFIVEY